jgi:antirestriction protein ArdC
VATKQKTAPIDKYELITNQICTLLERGIKPWRKPWKAGHDRIPFQNLVTRHIYTGSNRERVTFAISINTQEE